MNMNISTFAKMATGCAAIALIAAGCSTTAPSATSAPSVLPAAPEPNMTTMLPLAKEQTYTIRSVESYLNVGSVQTAKNILGDALQEAVTRHFVGRDFRFTPQSPDIVITLTPSLSVFDQAGEYFVTDGKATAVVTLPGDSNRIIAQKIFDARSDRVLTEAKAAENAASKIVPTFDKWLRDEVTVSKTGLEAKLFEVDCQYHEAKEDAAYIAKFISAVKGMDGIVDCALATQDTLARRLSFRVVYQVGKFPEGALNAIIARNEALKLVWKK